MVRIGSRHLEKKKKKLNSFSNASTETFKCMQLSCALFEVSMFTFLFFGFRCNGKLVETMFSKRSCPKTRRLSRLTYIKICELIEDGIKFNATTDTCFQITNLSLNMFLIWSGQRICQKCFCWSISQDLQKCKLLLKLAMLGESKLSLAFSD